MPTAPSLPALLGLIQHGHARVPLSWEFDGPIAAGLFWRIGDTAEVIATPALMRLSDLLPTEGETLGALLATEARYRDPWLRLEAARLRELGQREELASLCDAIHAIGPAAEYLRENLSDARLAPTGQAVLELALFGGSADQPMAALPLRRALALTAPLIEGGRGAPHAALPQMDLTDLEANWLSGRLLQAPGAAAGTAGDAVMSGHVFHCEGDRMTWVLATPWITLLAVLGFTAEAWTAERRGGVQLELPIAAVQTFGAPPRIDVVVTLPDGIEVLCGSLGELCLRLIDALGMAVVPSIRASDLDVALAPVVTTLLRAEVWLWQSDARSRYIISDSFSLDCCRGLGHRAIYLAGERLFQTFRSVCVAWARSRIGEAEVRP